MLGFDAERLEGFLRLLPRSTAEAARLAAGHDERLEGRAWTEIDADRPLRHALEVRHADFAIAAITFDTTSSGTTISTLTFGRKSTVYSLPR